MIMRDWNADEIKGFRQALGLSQIAFGKAIGVTRMHVYYLERGERKASQTMRILLEMMASHEDTKKTGKKGGSSNGKGSL
jgi:DNA-binding transcriptional regulator YiaG